jgi:hypothetical protein
MDAEYAEIGLPVLTLMPSVFVSRCGGCCERTRRSGSAPSRRTDAVVDGMLPNAYVPFVN